MQQSQLEKTDTNDSYNIQRLAIKVKNKYCFISTNDIKYISSSSYYVEIFTVNKEKFLYRISIKDFIEQLDSAVFLRVNRSTIINIFQVKELISEGQGDYSISMLDGTYFSLSKIYKKDFLRFFGIRVSK